MTFQCCNNMSIVQVHIQLAVCKISKALQLYHLTPDYPIKSEVICPLCLSPAIPIVVSSRPISN